jgi:Ca-activated chloride channel family protein
MGGAPLAKAKEVVRRALAGLRPDDTFQIVRFADRASALGAAPIANKPRNVALALGWLDTLAAEGGTEMIDGVRAALDFPHDPDRLRVVLFLTDGYVGNEDDVLATVHARLGASRLFSFGVGSAVNRYLLEEMAAFGRGDASVVRPDEDTGTAVDRFLARIATPVMTDVTVDWKGLPVRALEPAAIPDLFLGQPLVVHGLYGAPGGRATIEVHGTIAGAPVTIPVDVTLPARAEGHAGVAAVWAKARIRALERGLLRGDDPGAVAEITRLALAHGLLTRYTSFVAVSEHVTGGGKATRVPVLLERPEHVGGAGFGGLGLSGTGYGGGGSGVGYASIGLASYGSGYGSGSGHGGAKGMIVGRTSKPPVVRIGTPVVVGSVDKSIVRRVIHAHLSKVRYLYERSLASSAAEGRIVLELIIDPSGAVADAKVASSDFPDGALGDALADEARSWEFPSAEGGGIVVVRYPFVFVRSDPMPAKKDDPLDAWWDDTLPPAKPGAGTEAR